MSLVYYFLGHVYTTRDYGIAYLLHDRCATVNMGVCIAR